MRQSLTLLFAWLACVAFADGPADNIPDNVRAVPPPGAKLPEEIQTELRDGATKLGAEIETLRGELKSKANSLALLPDVQIFQNAIRYAVTHNEIFNPTNEVPAARALLKLGLDRAQQLRDGRTQWISATGLVVRGYVSRLDGSVQPYGLVVPPSYQPNGTHAFRLDVWFHGRDEKLSELNFLTQRLRSAGEFVAPNTIVLHTYGRYCNGQRFAGEVDVFEALADVRKNYPIDDSRIVVRGFSLGGGACWHIAVHYPGNWAAAAPGAGFSETADFLKVFQREKVQPTWYEKKLWHLYDSTDYAVNLFNLPTVAYSGELDSQKQAADMMAKAVAAEGMELTHIIGPQTRHAYHPGAKQEISRRINHIAELGRDPLPKQIRFTTWTLRYNQMAWLAIDGLEEHWARARVDAEILDSHTVRVKTENVSRLTLSMPSGQCPFDGSQRIRVLLDDKELTGPRLMSDRSWQASFYKLARRWFAGTPGEEPPLRKRSGLQGPIDDAFMSSFLVVRPTGKAANEKVGVWTLSELAHATNHWRQQFRGEARVKDDVAVTDAEIAAHNLILFGDPASNQLLAKIADKLPLGWNSERVQVGKKLFPGDHHAAILIYPNPLNPQRYVVLNSGFTFREYDYLNNARQVPRLPDYAVADLNVPVSSRSPGGIVEAGFFNEQWQLTANAKSTSK